MTRDWEECHRDICLGAVSLDAAGVSRDGGQYSEVDDDKDGGHDGSKENHDCEDQEHDGDMEGVEDQHDDPSEIRLVVNREDVEELRIAIASVAKE